MKEKWLRLTIIMLIVAIFGGLFYWYELRPAQIKKDCSWVKQVRSAQQEVTEAQAIESQKRYEECLKEKGNPTGLSKLGVCGYAIDRQDYVPESIYYRKASKTEYDFCVHSKGL